MAYKTHTGAVRQAQRLSNADGAPRLVVGYRWPGGSHGEFDIVADLIGLARFYEQRIDMRAPTVTVVQPHANEDARKATPPKRKWQTIYQVPPEATEVVECRARCSRGGTWTVEQLGGHRFRLQYNQFWYEQLFGTTPEEAIEKFLARQAQRLARLEQDRAEIQQQLRNASALRAEARP